MISPRVTSPPTHRPSKMSRGYPTSNTSHHHNSVGLRHSTRYPVSPTVPSGGNQVGGVGGVVLDGAIPFNDSEDFTPEDIQAAASKRRQEMTRTPEVMYISREVKIEGSLISLNLGLHLVVGPLGD